MAIFLISVMHLPDLNVSKWQLKIEYRVANKVSVHGDIYSYGILLTAKRPTDEMFKEAQSLLAISGVGFF